MSTRLYLHDAARDVSSGSWPAGEQSASTADVTWTGANTLKTMDTSIGAAQVDATASTLGQTASQKHFIRFFATTTFDVNQTVGGGTWTFNGGQAESSTAANFGLDGVCIYVWRPSTGAVVGYVKDVTLDLIAAPGSEAGVTETVSHWTFTTSAVSALAGDVLIAEVWQTNAQGSTTARTVDFYYDGTTVNTTHAAAATNHAAFIEAAENLTFGTPTGGAKAMPVFQPSRRRFIVPRRY
jgi:hypothetical protein